MAKDKKQKAKSKIVYSNARKVAEKQATQGGGRNLAVKLPDGVEAYKFKKGINKFDVLPYRVGAGNPACDEGMVHYERTYFAHANVGPENKLVCCPAQTFGKKCPICAYSAKLMRQGKLDEETRNALRTKTRQLFCFRDHDDGKKLKIQDGSFYRGFGEVLQDKLMAVEDDHPYSHFHSLEDGMQLSVMCKEVALPGGKFNQPSNIEMVPRKTQLDDSVLDDVPCLDDLLICLDYDALEEMFQGGETGADAKPADEKKKDKDDEDEDEDDDEKPAKSKSKGKKKVEEEDEDDDDDSGDDEESEIEVGDTVTFFSKTKKKKQTGKVVKLKDDTAQVKGNGWQEAVDVDELTKVEPDDDEDTDEEDDDDDEPVGKKKGKGKPSKDDDDDDDEEDEDDDEDESVGDDSDGDDDSDDEDEDDEPVTKKKGKAGKGKKAKDEEEEVDLDDDDDVPFDDEDDDDDDDDDDEPAPKKKGKK